MDLSAGSVVRSPRLIERRRAVRAARRRTRRRILLVLLVVVGIGVGAWRMSRSMLFAIESVEVRGARSVTALDVVRASGVAVGASILEVDAARVAADVTAALPSVRDVRIERVGALGLRLVVIEREPALLVKVGRAVRVLDADGTLLPGARAPRARLPVVEATRPTQLTRAAAEEVLAIWRSLPRSVARRGVVFLVPDSAGHRFRVGDVEVVFGSAADASAKATALAAVLRDARADNRAVTAVDVRIPERPAARVV